MLEKLEERERRREAARDKARRALFIDMLKSYAGPILVAAFINPLLASATGRLGGVNYALLLVGLAMIGCALTFVEAKE